MRDSHHVIVYNVGEMIGGKTIRLHQHLIVEHVCLNFHCAVNDVVECDFFVNRHLQTNHIWDSILQIVPHIVISQGAAMPVVHWRQFLRLHLWRLSPTVPACRNNNRRFLMQLTLWRVWHKYPAASIEYMVPHAPSFPGSSSKSNPHQRSVARMLSVAPSTVRVWSVSSMRTRNAPWFFRANR